MHTKAISGIPLKCGCPGDIKWTILNIFGVLWNRALLFSFILFSMQKMGIDSLPSPPTPDSFKTKQNSKPLLPRSHQGTLNHLNSLWCRSSWRLDHPHLPRSRFRSWWWRESPWPPPQEQWAGQECWEPLGLKDKGTSQAEPSDPSGSLPEGYHRFWFFKSSQTHKLCSLKSFQVRCVLLGFCHILQRTRLIW